MTPNAGAPLLPSRMKRIAVAVNPIPPARRRRAVSQTLTTGRLGRSSANRSMSMGVSASLPP